MALDVEGFTVANRFLATVRSCPDQVALRWRVGDGAFSEMTYREYADQVAHAVSGLRSLGLGPGMRMVMMMRNAPQFHILDVAATFCGATPVSIYNSSSVEQVCFAVTHSEATIAVAGDKTFLDKFVAVRNQVPDLREIVVVDSGGEAGTSLGSGVTTYEELLAQDPVDLDDAASNCKPEQLATLIYTSGTTGSPKAVMLDHRNIAWTAESTRIAINWESLVGRRLISYLPMAHIAERMVSHYLAMFVGMEVTTCPDPREIGDFIKAVRPEVMFGVPRVWEKIYGAVNGVLAADPEKKRQFDEAIEAAIPITHAIAWDRATDDELATWNFLDEVAFAGVRQIIGLDACELAVTSAAPLSPEVLRWFRAIGVPLSEVYGLSETTGPMTWSPYRVKPGSSGVALPETEVTLDHDGEVLCRGGNIFRGYFKDQARTDEVLDGNGWLRTGDIGQLDEDGYLTIVDRKKELIITAGGKNVSPANLEAALKMIPLVSQAAAVGDRRPFIAAVVTLDPDVAPQWARSQGIEFENLDSLARDPRVVEEIERGLEEVMKQFNAAERVKKVKIVGEEWLTDSDVLTPTSKLKRRGIAARYRDEIEAIYSS